MRLSPHAAWLAAVTLLAAAAAAAQFELASRDGKSTIKLGLLAQPQGEWLDTANADGTSQNLFVRRLRFLLGGKIGEKISFFVETDSPNLGKADATGRKSEATTFMQDVIVTYAFSPRLMIDSGLLLTPNSHNSGQGATTLLPVEYGPYSFLHSAPTGSRVGRDYGVQARGYLAGSHFEYRVGVFQGARDAGSTNALRTVARAVYYPFEAETGFFYSGTNFGQKKILAIGASWDRQGEYQAPALDVYLDWPVGKDALTLQADWIGYDGGTTFAALPSQDVLLVEGSYFIHAVRLGPYLQVARKDLDGAGADEASTQLGLAYWHAKHAFNVKLGLGRLEKDGAKDRDQVVLQCQLYFY